MTFSASKSYLATLAGLALDQGLIRDLDDPVREYVDDGGFDPPHNSKITWRHLLQQTSEWSGTLWGKPDQVDHNRGVGATQANFAAKGTRRDLQEPGTYWEYNDVRVNRLSLALLRIWKRWLPGVFKAERHGPDRRLGHLGVARLQQLVRRDRRAASAVGQRRRALGRRRLGQRLRSRAIRTAPPAARSLGRSAGAV